MVLELDYTRLKIRPRMQLYCLRFLIIMKLLEEKTMIVQFGKLTPGVHFIKVKCHFRDFKHFFFGIINSNFGSVNSWMSK